MALVGFQYKPISLDVNEVCFKEEQNIPNTREKSRKSSRTKKKNVTALCRCGKRGIINTNVEYLS